MRQLNNRSVAAPYKQAVHVLLFHGDLNVYPHSSFSEIKVVSPELEDDVIGFPFV